MNPQDVTRQATASTLRPPEAEVATVNEGAEPSVAELRRGVSIGRFVMIDQLGAGAMGEVVLAYDPDLHRRVAIKVLRASLFSSSGGAAVQRMLREARAMAKLSHPNVITVFEVDQMDSGQSFIAMEFVDGGTLRDWNSTSPSWKQVVEVYAAAGAGLAAAHEQDLVHRDFKPDNVLMGSDGRVCVTDFGLVGALDIDDDPASSVRESVQDTAASGSGRISAEAEVTLTRTGSMLGTPAYMAPEAGKELDARSDQFSFCVSLYEALYGHRPFAGDTLAELRANVCDGRRLEIPRETKVPRRVQNVVERGLANDPSQRWPDMRSLLVALQRNPAEQKGRWLFGAVALGLTGSALSIAAGLGAIPEPACSDGSPRVEEVWNPKRSSSLRDSFAGANADAAPKAHQAVEDALASFTDEWKAGHLDACEAHRVRGEQSGSLFDRRMLCLQRRLDRVDTLLDAFATPQASTVAAANNIGGAMPSVDTCANTELLASMVPPPDAPDIRKEWKRLHHEIDRADALGVAGREADALAAFAEIRESIQTLDHGPQLARYLQNYGNALLRNNRFEDAVEVLRSAPEAAARADDPRIEANVWLLLAKAHGFGLGDPKTASWMARAAEVAGQRAGGDPTTQLNIQFTRAILAQEAGDYAQAVEAAERTVASAEIVFGHAHRNTSASYGTLGNAFHKVGELDKAREAHRTSLEIDRGLHEGPHADIGHSLINIALLDDDAGAPETAKAGYEEALRVYEQAVGTDHAFYRSAQLNLAGNAAKRKDFDAARKGYREMLAFYEETLPKGHPDFGTIYINLAEVSLAEGELDAALRDAKRGLALRVEALGPDHAEVVLGRLTLGKVLFAREEFVAAEEELREALRVADASLPPEHGDRVDVLLLLGEVLITTNRHKQAEPLVNLAVELAQDRPGNRLKRAQALLASTR
ncbi:MAG: tetratricopeptide repeat protein [Nannocystales bacterium]